MALLEKERSVRFAEGAVTLPKLTHAYRPELHRQVTERLPFGHLGRALHTFVERGLGEALDPLAIATAREELNSILSKIELSWRRNRVGLEVLPRVHVHCFTHWQVRPDMTIVCLMPIEVHKATLVPEETGRFFIRLPNRTKNRHNTSPTEVCTRDGQHASPRKLHVICAKVWKNALVKHGIPKDDIVASLSPGDLQLGIKLPCGWHAELVPCLSLPDDVGVYYVARGYCSEVTDKGDLTWQPCFANREHELLDFICRTDGGLRMRAMQILCRALPRDWRLAHVTCYQVQTALLHDVDFHVDFSPRWQRLTLEGCVRSLLATLHHFSERGNLPHFDLNQLNLWSALTPKRLALARSALSRLSTNENAVISLLRRASLV